MASRRSARLAIKGGEGDSDRLAAKGEEGFAGVVKGQGKLEKFDGANIKEFEQEYQAVPIDIDDVPKLGDFCEMSHSGGHCGWRAAQMMVNHKGDLPDFIMQLREDYEDESIRGKMRPKPLKYDKSVAEHLRLKRKRKAKDFFEVIGCLGLVARRHKKSLMSYGDGLGGGGFTYIYTTTRRMGRGRL